MRPVPEAGGVHGVGGHSPSGHSGFHRWGDASDYPADDVVPSGVTDAEQAEVDMRSAACLRLAAGRADGGELAGLLHSEDPVTAAACEQALWSLWFNAAGAGSAATLHRAMALSADDRASEALMLLDDLVREHAEFAEAYHQRGMVHTLREDHGQAMGDFLRAVQLNRIHFAAMANLGHCCVQLGRYDAAREWYLAALQIHPRLPGVRQMLRRLRELVLPGPHTHA